MGSTVNDEDMQLCLSL